jgi:hypothetical protein
MGQLVLTIAGGALGSLIGMPQLGMIVGGAIGGALFGGSGAGGPRLEDKTVSASTYGVAIPRSFGTVRMASNLIWTDGIKEHKSGGGKGMGSGQKTYTYTCSFAVAFCVGEIDEILRIWADTKLLFGAADMNKLRDALKNGADFGTLLGAYQLGKKKKKYKLRIYRGSEDQLPDALIVSKKGADSTPAYRGLCYAVFEDMPLADYGNRIPNISGEVTRSKSASLPSLTFEDLGGGEAYLPNAYFDWDANRAVNAANGNFEVYSLRTMKMIAKFPMPPNQSGSKIGCCPGGGPVVMQYGGSNSRKVVLLDGNTFTPYLTMGRTSNSLGEFPFTECTGVPGDQGATAFLVANGYFHCMRVQSKNSYSYYFVNFNGFGGNSLWDFNGNFINFLSRNGNALTLAENAGSTDFCVWGGNSDDSVWVDKYTITGEVAKMDLVESPDCGRGLKEVLTSVADLNPQTFVLVPPNGGTIQQLLYNETDNTILVTCFNGSPYIAIWSLDDAAFTKVIPCPGTFPIGGLGRSRLTGYKLGYARTQDNHIVTIDLNTGDATEQFYAPAFNLFDSTTIWDDATQSVYFAYLGNGNHWVRVFSQNLPQEVTVGSIVSEILDDTGQLDQTDYDTTDLNDITVTGYLVGREATARDIITQLGGAYFFDGVESDYQIKFVKRGGASKVTILEDQMGNLSDRDVQLRETLAQETEAPMRVTINYMDQDRDYQTASQFSKRIANPFPAVNTRREDKVELPIVLNADQAKQMSDKALKAAWVGRVSNESVLPWRFLKYDPTDVVTYTMNDGSTRISRFTKMDIGEDMTIKTTGVNDSAVAYVSNLTGDSGSVPPQVAGDPTPADIVVLNTPLLRDTDDTQGVGSVIYLSAVTPTGPFGGAYLQKADTGEDFADIGPITKEPIAGYTVNKLEPTRSWAAMDTTSVVKVLLYDNVQTLESCSYDELMAGKNLAIVGNEVIQFQTAEVDANGYWNLTNILRARRGTDPYLDTHAIGERFIMPAVDGSIMINTRNSIDEKHDERIRAVVSGETVDDSVGLTYEIDPNDLRPYTVANVKVTDLDAGISISFDRRSRITNTLTDGDPSIPYREGDTASGNYSYVLWSTTLGDAAKPWVTPTDGTTLRTGQIGVAGLVDGTLSILDPKIDFADLGVPAIGDGFVIQIAHNGFVKGFPSYRYFEKQGDGTYAVTELFP